jgi:CspA family cold shock protein
MTLQARRAVIHGVVGEVDMPETGVVKWFNNDKGYGFIKRSTGEDVFCHHSSIQASGYRTLNEGERVEFDVKQGPKGLQAENVRRMEGGHQEEEAV